MDDQEIFNSVSSNEPVADAPAVAEAEVTTNRDAETGRYAAAQAAETAPVAPAATEQESAQVPSWRLREVREEAERRNAALERELIDLRKRAPVEDKPKPDIFDDPNAFVQNGVREALAPVSDQVSQMREFYSQRDAVREHGKETVQQAFQALDTAAKSGDPDAQATVARVKASLHPFDDIVSWHKRQAVLSQVQQAGDLDKWFEKQLEERAKDPAFRERFSGQAQPGKPAAQAAPVNIVKLPPSLNKIGSASSGGSSDGDVSDAELFQSATSGRR